MVSIREGSTIHKPQPLQQHSKTEMGKGWKGENPYTSRTKLLLSDVGKICNRLVWLKKTWRHCSTEKLKSIWALKQTAVFLESKTSLKAGSKIISKCLHFLIFTLNLPQVVENGRVTSIPNNEYWLFILTVNGTCPEKFEEKSLPTYVLKPF